MTGFRYVFKKIEKVEALVAFYSLEEFVLGLNAYFPPFSFYTRIRDDRRHAGFETLRERYVRDHDGKKEEKWSSAFTSHLKIYIYSQISDLCIPLTSRFLYKPVNCSLLLFFVLSPGY